MRRHLSKLAVVAVVGVAFMAAACGSDKNEGSGATTTAAGAATTSPEPTRLALRTDGEIIELSPRDAKELVSEPTP